MARALVCGLLLSTVGALAAPLAAQKQPQEFTTQGLLIGDFESTPVNVGRKVADRIRGKVDDAFSNKELKLVSRRAMSEALLQADIEEKSQLARALTATLAKYLRADEYVTGLVTQPTKGRYRIDGYLVLVRDKRFRQPLETVEDANLDAAAERMARDVVAARGQLAPQRRCENFTRDGRPQEAMAAALVGVAAYPRSTLARGCYLVALGNAGASGDTLLKLSNQILAIDPDNAVALQHAAIAYDSKHDRTHAGEMWLRLLRTDSLGLSRIEWVVSQLAKDGNAALAKPIIERAVKDNPDHVPFARLQWLVYLALGEWHPAIDAGLRYAKVDSTATTESAYFERLATAYASDSQPLKAIETAAHGVAQFPKDADLYTLYAQLVRGEAEVVLPRAAQEFPNSGKIQALYAQSLQNAGAKEKALAATRRALEIDPHLPRGFLQLAQAYMDVSQPDSALAALEEGLKNGEDTSLVVQYALSRGNALYKAANATSAIPDYQRAMTFINFADRYRSSRESKFLLGATSFAIGQIAVTTAPKTKDCTLAKLADQSFNETESSLNTGGAVAPDAAKQMLDWVAQARPSLTQQLTVFCGESRE